MAIAAGVLVQIFLVVVLRGIEIEKGQDFHLQRLLVFFLLQGVARPDLRQLGRVRIVDPGAVLDPHVAALPVVGGGVHGKEVPVQQLGQTDPRRVVFDADGLGVAGAAADLLIAGVFRGAVGVAHLRADDPIKLIEKLLGAPEAAPGQIDAFDGHTGASSFVLSSVAQSRRRRKDAFSSLSLTIYLFSVMMPP